MEQQSYHDSRGCIANGFVLRVFIFYILRVAVFNALHLLRTLLHHILVRIHFPLALLQSGCRRGTNLLHEAHCKVSAPCQRIQNDFQQEEA